MLPDHSIALLVSVNEWQALYIDRMLCDQNHSLDLEESLRLVVGHNVDQLVCVSENNRTESYLNKMIDENAYAFPPTLSLDEWEWMLKNGK